MQKTSLLFLITLFQLVLLFEANAQSKQEKLSKESDIDLSGSWLFRIDSLDKGIMQKWYSRHLSEKIRLPGSMTSNGFGNDITDKTPWTGGIEDSTWFHDPGYAKYRVPGNVKVPFWLQPDKYYKGAAWYQKEVEIPSSWKGKYIEMYLERCHWETTVWVDGKNAGMQNSLATAHVYDLSSLLTAGKHMITVRVDNRVKDINFGQNSHSITDHTQSNWNGMVGRLLLKQRPPVYISDVQLFPDIKLKQVIARISLNNMTGKNVNCRVNLMASTSGSNAEKLKAVAISKIAGKTATFEITYPMGANPLLWSEFTPDIYYMHVKVSVNGWEDDIRDVIFGMREFTSNGTQFAINGRPTFLRGSLECAEFPKSGFPPTDVESWLRIFKICKSYGLNHLRFHSWCPPDAAFEAADLEGVYLHIECSSWANQGASIGDGKPLDQYIYEESRNIIKDYGNHPSFCMLVYGNEPAGAKLTKYLTDFVVYWKKRDQRRLYSTAAGWPVIPEADYNSTPDPRIQRWGEGLKSIINGQPPRTDYDWSAIIGKWQHPTVSHEIGQWCVYPDFKEIKQYDGVLKAKNFEIFRDQLEKNGLGNLADDFLYASGKLQVLCYKAEIEAALRTPGFGGFQLLGLYDFPGQGTALVGVLNPFWKDKGYVTGKEYSQFCNAVVPLARFPKMVFLNNEQLTVPVEIAQFGASILKNATPHWYVKDDLGHILFKGDLKTNDILYGNGIKLGNIDQPLSSIAKASRLTLTVEVAGRENSWDFFVYPSVLPGNDQVLVTQTLDEKAVKVLNDGGKVLLTLKKGTLKADKGGNIAIGFSSIFWNTAWTKQQPPVTLGVLCDPKHAAFKDFPTQAYSNWQWWDAMSHSNPIKLDAVSAGLQPIVRVIDDWVSARSLGLVFECGVGKGKLVVSGIDLLSENSKRPEARQLLYSLTHYMSTTDFKPAVNVGLEDITGLYQ